MGIQHWLTSPHRPQSNGKVEHFFRTLDEECLLIRNPRCSELRIRDVEQILWYYHHQRPHLSLRGLNPVQRRQTYVAQIQMCLRSWDNTTGHYKDKPGSAIMNGSNAIPVRPA